MKGDIMTSTFRIAIFGIISLLLLTAWGTAATIQTTSIELSGAGEQGDIPIILDSLPAGLAGYKMTITVSPESVADIAQVTLPEWATLKQVDETFPSSMATITGVDLMDTVQKDSTQVNLCTLTIEAISAGTATLTFSISELTDDDGNAISYEIVPAVITVAASAEPTATPVPEVTTTPVVPVPTDQLPLDVTVEPTEVPTTIPTTEVPTPVETVVPMATPTPVPTVEADFYSSMTTGNAPVTLYFTDNSSGYPDTFWWDFGDGSSDNTSVVQNPQHTYKIPGVYSVSLTASNSVYSNTSTKSNYITVNAMKLPERGEKNTITINSVPEGAEVYLNNAYQGKTPVMVPNLTTKNYQLRLHLDGYFDVVQSIIVNEGVLPTFISGYKLVPHPPTFGQFVSDPPQTGAAYIVSYPDDVEVYVDEGKVGKTDLMIMNLAVGIHNLTLVRDGFANWTDTIDVKNALGVIQTYYYEQPYFPRNRTVSYVDLP